MDNKLKRFLSLLFLKKKVERERKRKRKRKKKKKKRKSREKPKNFFILQSLLECGVDSLIVSITGLENSCASAPVGCWLLVIGYWLLAVSIS